MGLEQHVSIPTQLKLHFEKMGHLQQPKPLVFNAQQVRMDFIQYCIHQGPKLGTPESTLEEYLKTDKEKLAVSNPDEVLTPGDLNRRKLSALFAHLSAFNYKMGGLTIEPIAVGDLIKKIHDINGMDDKRVAEYLETLVGSQIPGAQEMPLDKFLENVGAMYQENGVNFHCYLRENFFQPLNKESIKEAAPALNYFMPEVFCQRHINTCELSTAMSILKKLATNFDQMQAWCISNNETMPENVLKSREKIKELEQQFDQFLKDPASISTQDLKKLQHNYLREVENIQIQMERSFGKKFNSSIEPYLKVHPNHTLATIHHLITTRIMPEGFDIDNDALQNNLRDQQTPFQAKLLGAHLGIVNEPDVVKNLHKDNSNTAEKEGFLDSIKRLFLYGKSRAFTDFVVCGHALVMDICNRGILKVIEHRNAKSEETILSKNGLSDIGIQSPAGKQENALEKTIMSIENKLKILYMERNNIIKIKLGTLNDPKVHAEIHSLLEKKDHEIRDLLEVEKNIKERYGLERHACPKTSFESHKDKFKSFQAERPQEKPNKEIVEEHHSQSTLIPNKV